MYLSPKAVEGWIEALRRDSTATTEAQPPDMPFSQFTEPATWHVNVKMVCYFYIPDDAAVERISTEMPNIYASFWKAIDRLPEKTQGKSGGVSRIKPDRLECIAERFHQGRDDLASINDFTARNKESSVEVSFKTMCSFSKSSRVGGELQI